MLVLHRSKHSCIQNEEDDARSKSGTLVVKEVAECRCDEDVGENRRDRKWHRCDELKEVVALASAPSSPGVTKKEE